MIVHEYCRKLCHLNCLYTSEENGPNLEAPLLLLLLQQSQPCAVLSFVHLSTEGAPCPLACFSEAVSHVF